MRFAFSWVLLATPVLAVSLTPRAASGLPSSDFADDEQTLKAAGVPSTGPALLDFSRSRTLSRAEQERMEFLVHQLGDDSFRVREKASADLVSAGPRALPDLRRALSLEDLEVKRRAQECIEAIERTSGAAAIAAAVRVLKVRRPTGAAAVLLDYLPCADEEVDEEIDLALLVLGVHDGQVDPAVTAVAQDRLPVRRAAAALVMGRSGTGEQRAAVRLRLSDPDYKVCYRAAQGLLAGRDKTAVPALFVLLTDAPFDVARQAEDLLNGLGGERAPAVALGDDADTRRRCREAWASWWKANEATVSLASVDVDLLSSSSRGAQDVAQRFLNACTRGSLPVLKNLTEAPFFVGDGLKFNTRAELDQFFKEVFGEMQHEKMTFSVTRVGRLDEYLKTGTDGEKEFLGRLPRSQVRVVYVRATTQGVADDAAVFVHTRAGRMRVAGIGEGKHKP